MDFTKIAAESGLDIASPEFAELLDSQDSLKELRNEFIIPKVKTVSPSAIGSGLIDPEADSIYLCGNSLGLQPKNTRKLLDEELEVWAEGGVEGHHHHKYDRPWISIDDSVINESARIVGAKPEEVAIMNTLTVNLHMLLIPFYRPEGSRYKILMEAKAFPSDYFALESQVKFHGYDPKDAIIQLEPKPGHFTLDVNDILQTIEEQGDSIALVLFSGVQYYTGQFFPIELITKKAHEKGCIVGWDMAHAAGNLPLHLHDWDVDFACWCTYKYINSGPGGIAGAFVHSKYFANFDRPSFAGWWGTELETRFLMDNIFRPIPGASVLRVSNPSVVSTVCLLGSLQVFEKTSMEELRAKSLKLTAYLEFLLDRINAEFPNRFLVITPRDPAQRGCQLSILLLNGGVGKIFQALLESGVVCDKREPDVIRLGPTPLYNTFFDIYRFFKVFHSQLAQQ